MKRFFIMATTCSLLWAGQASRAESVVSVNPLAVQKMTSAILSKVTKTSNVINWAIGDYHNLKVSMLFGSGTGHKEATKEEKELNAIWYVSEINLMGQKQKVEALIDRANGKTLKQIINGKEEAIGDEKQDIEILEQSETEVTVPAGKFDCLYIKAKIKAQGQEQEVEIWVNPVDINLDGMLKVVIQSTFGPITMTLTDFGSAKK